VRCDRWLLAARIFKTRDLAATACDGGKVEVNSTAAKPHKLVRPGDRLRVTTRDGRRELVVRALGERRLPAPQAQLLYDDVTPPPPPEPPFPGGAPPGRDRGAGRPTKRDRRLTERMRFR
jgi:ribosome-associated heat shock protein Hsp15